jgi:putative membrane protein
MNYTNYFLGMNWVWWILWIMLLISIFLMPFSIPGQRYKKATALDVLERRFNSGKISQKEYQEKKIILENTSGKTNNSNS